MGGITWRHLVLAANAAEYRLYLAGIDSDSCPERVEGPDDLYGTRSDIVVLPGWRDGFNRRDAQAIEFHLRAHEANGGRVIWP